MNALHQAKTDPTESVVHLRSGLINHGYRVVACVGKEARGDNWQYSKWEPTQMDGFTRLHHYATNTGLVCGELVGLDIDTPDPDVADAITAMVAELPSFSAAPYRIGRAPKCCYLFRATNPRRRVASGKYLINGHPCQIEVLGVGQQFVAYGTHPDTLRPYEWFNGSPAETPLADLPEITTADIDALLARADAYFAEHGTPIKKAKAANDNQRSGEVVGDPDHPWSIVKQRAYANLGAWVKDLQLEDLEPYDAGYRSVASFRPTNSKTAKERKRALNIQPVGICDYGDNDKGYSPIDLVAACLHMQDHAAFDWLKERVGGGDDDGTKPVSASNIASLKAQPERRREAALAELDAGLTVVDVKTDTPFPLINPSEWRGTVAKVREWFLSGLIPHRQVTLLSGDGGVGKSLLGLQIGAASALAIATLGLQPRYGRVLYIGAEDEAAEFHRRLADICAAHQREIGDLANLRILPLADQDALLSEPDKKGSMQPTALWARVDKFVQEWKPGLVVLDTAADLFGGDEVKRAQVRQFVAMLRKMAIQRDCAVLLLAHPSVAGMASGSGYSGSTAWNNSVRSRLYLTSGEGDIRTLKTVKSNYGKTGDEMLFEWCEGAFVLHDPSKPGLTDGLINGRNDKVFVSVLSKLNRTGQRPSPNKSPSFAPRMVQKHPDAKGVKVRDMETAMQRLLDSGTIKIVQEGPPSRRFSRLIVSSEDFGGADDG